MILGIGNDVIEINRVGEIVEGKLGARFIRRVLTAGERKLCEQRHGKHYEFVAGRFAIKEAIVKALGCGIGECVGFQDIEVLPNGLGKPMCNIRPEAMARLALNADSINIHISISHSKTMVSAMAVVERV